MFNPTKDQLEAIERDGENIIVSAGAGSGKTAVLSERVIHKLKKGVHINEFLILTFTNNAAGEMKDRIKKKIAKEKSLEEELKLIEAASITTFDAYVLALVKKYHYSLGIDANVNIIDSSIIKMKKKEIIDELFKQYYEENDQNFINLVTKYGVKNDKSIKNKILNLDNTLDLKVNKDEFLKSYINEYYKNENLEKLFNGFEENIKIRIQTIKNSLYNLSFEVDEKFNKKINEILNPLLNSNSFDEIKANIPLSFSGLRMPNGSSDKAKYYKAQIKLLLDDIKKVCSFSKEDLINDICNTKNDALIIFQILDKLNSKIMEYKYEHNMFEFNDISKFAINLLKNNESIRLEIKNSYKEIMIDEYQDTSDMQDTFIKLIENNNVYMVGDVKQSIYRFRNANPDIFKDKYNAYVNHIGGSKIDLKENFRSRKEVLYSINNIFDHIMDDSIGNAMYKKEHRLIPGNHSYDELAPHNYNLEIYNYKKEDNEHSEEEIEAFIIGNDILNKINNHYKVSDDNTLRDVTFKDFCILIDRTTSFPLYNEVFNYLHIPLNVYKDEDILFTDEISLINNILGFVIAIKENNYLEYNYYYASIARSYLIEEEDSVIYDVITNKKVKDTLIYEKCKNIGLQINSLSNYQILTLIIDEFDFYNKLYKVGDVNKRTIILNNILNKARDYNKIGNSIYDFKNYLSNLMDNKEPIKLSAIIKENDSVTITNIHKSKGLEYKICYFAGFHKKFNIMDINDRILYSNNYGLILPVYNEGFRNTFVNNIYKEKYIKDEISEKLRLLYVALTRAKEKMIIVTSLKEGLIVTSNEEEIIDYLDRINYRSFADVLNSIYSYIEDYIVDTQIPLINDEYKIKKEFRLNDYVKSDKKIDIINKKYEFISKSEEHFSKTSHELISSKEKENMFLGTRLHYVLENIDFYNPDYSGLSEFEINVVKSLLNSDILKNIKSGRIYKEYEFTFEDKDSFKTGIIDLMIEYDEYIDIIDYKLKNTADAAYLKQLNGYKSFINNKTGKNVNIYLYSLLNKTLKPLL